MPDRKFHKKSNRETQYPRVGWFAPKTQVKHSRLHTMPLFNPYSTAKQHVFRLLKTPEIKHFRERFISMQKSISRKSFPGRRWFADFSNSVWKPNASVAVLTQKQSARKLVTKTSVWLKNKLADRSFSRMTRFAKNTAAPQIRVANLSFTKKLISGWKPNMIRQIDDAVEAAQEV